MSERRKSLRFYVHESDRRRAPTRRMTSLLVEFGDIYDLEILDIEQNQRRAEEDGIASPPALVIDDGVNKRILTGPFNDEREIRRFLLW